MPRAASVAKGNRKDEHYCGKYNLQKVQNVHQLGVAVVKCKILEEKEFTLVENLEGESWESMIRMH